MSTSSVTLLTALFDNAKRQLAKAAGIAKGDKVDQVQDVDYEDLKTRLNAKPGTYLLRQLIQTLQDINAQAQYRKSEEPDLLDAVMDRDYLKFSINDNSVYDAQYDLFYSYHDNHLLNESLISEKTSYRDQEGYFYISLFDEAKINRDPLKSLIKIGFFREGVKFEEQEAVTLEMADIKKDEQSKSRLSALLNFIIARL